MVYTLASRRTSDKQYFKPTMTHFNDAYMRRSWVKHATSFLNSCLNTVTPRKLNRVSNRKHSGCLFSSLFKLTAKRHESSLSLSLCEGNSLVNSYCSMFAVLHYDYVIMGAMASQITSLTIVYSTVYSDSDQRKHQSSASLAFVWGIHRGLVNSPHKWPVTRKMSPFDDVTMYTYRHVLADTGTESSLLH